MRIFGSERMTRCFRPGPRRRGVVHPCINKALKSPAEGRGPQLRHRQNLLNSTVMNDAQGLFAAGIGIFVQDVSGDDRACVTTPTKSYRNHIPPKPMRAVGSVGLRERLREVSTIDFRSTTVPGEGLADEESRARTRPPKALRRQREHFTPESSRGEKAFFPDPGSSSARP